MSEIGIVKEFKVKVSQFKAILDLTLYILAYGIGPMLLTPLQVMAPYGRNPVCIIGLAIFVLFNVPIVSRSSSRSGSSPDSPVVLR